MPNLQGLHGYQKESVARIQGIYNISGECHGTEEIQQPPLSREVVYQGPQGFTYHRSSWNVTKAHGQLK